MSETVLRDVILPAAFNKNGTKFLDCEFDKKYGAQDNFQSSVFFLTASVKRGVDVLKIPLVVKFQPKDENVIKELHTNIQFYNEILMYRELLPNVNKNKICEDTYPTFYYGVGTLVNPEKDVIVIEDLRPKGFRLTDEKVYIDLQHVELAMEKLGRFHALSYVAKHENPAEFHRLVGKLKESSWVDPTAEGWSNLTIRKCFHRAMDPLVTSGRYAAVLRRMLARVDEPGGVVRFMQELVAAEEPVAVLCHGDFCRNNMLFRYTVGAPVDVRFFDVATARYSSPVVDISFFLLMNTTAAVRAAHWDRLLSLYHSALASTVAALTPEAAVPSLQTLREEVKLKAVYGFFHASFFLPMMLWGEPQEMESVEEFTPEDVGNFNATLGGEEGTRLLVDMVEELVDRGCLSLDHPFLKNFVDKENME